MNVLFIQPRTRKCYAPSFESGGQNAHPPLGLMTLGNKLLSHGHQVRILDFLVEKPGKTSFTRLLDEFKPALVGITAYTETFRVAEQLAAEVRHRIETCPIVLGGVFPTFEFEAVLENEVVDYVVRFEGEDTLLELLEHIQYPALFPLARIPGLVYRNGAGIAVNPERKRSKRLDAQLISDGGSLRLSLYTHGGTVSSGRGCGHDCLFCSSSAMFGMAPRMRSPEHLFAEIYYLNRRHGLKEFMFVDQAFTALQERTRAFCRYVTESDLDIRWQCLSRVDDVNEDLLRIMFTAGCRTIEYGVESGDPGVLEKIGKGITLERIKEVIRLSTKTGYRVVCFFMLGHYADTPASMENTMDFAVELKTRCGVEIIPRMNTPFPGTFQFDHARELGLRIHAEDWEDLAYTEAVVSTDRFTQDQLRSTYVEFVRRLERCPI